MEDYNRLDRRKEIPMTDALPLPRPDASGGYLVGISSARR
jgi:hypothetical protein